jgi:[acyl-carrier-protein] S-malonyltransferase
MPLLTPAFAPAASLLPSAARLPLTRARPPAVRPAATSTASSRSGPFMSTVILAPGQGAQVPGMLSEWTAASPAAAALVSRADTLLGHRLHPGMSLSELAASASTETLNRTDIAQPAIYVASLACWTGMVELGLVSEGRLAVTAGLSLGEYSALVVAGAISFDDGLELVTLRGRAMQDAAEASSGGMVALIGASEEDAAAVVTACQTHGSVLVAANFNAPGQVVLSGSTDCIDKAAAYASTELKLRVAKLDVAGAFHSPLMAPAAERLAAALGNTSIAVPSVPVLSNVTGTPHNARLIRERLVQQLTSPVRWADCIDYIKNDSALAAPDAVWVELAPGKTLTGIMRKIDRKVKVQNMSSPPVVA